MRLEVLPEAAALASAAAHRIAAIIDATEGEAVVALAGGSTPRATYRRLATMALSWERIVWFLGDERFVPPHDPESNLRMVNESLGPQARTIGVETWLTQEQAARDYERYLGIYGSRHRLFDLVILGLGADGHTASLFPGSAVLEETEHLVRPTENGRITLTYRALNSSRHTIFLVGGAEKREALKRLLAGDTSIPAGRIHGEDVVVFADEAAAG